jgi:hypothetical protein
MNEAPKISPQPSPTPMPPEQPATVVQSVQPQGSQKLSTWSLILGIASIVLGLVVFISIPAAIVAIILGIIVLNKHLPGKSKALAGIITAGVFLVILIPLGVLTILTFNSVTQQANDAVKLSTRQAAERKAAAVVTKVDTLCYSYPVPTNYEYDTASKYCTTAVNIPKGDALTRITVKGNTGTIGTLQDVVTLFNKTIQNGDPKAPGVVDQESLIIRDRPVYYISYKDSYGLLFGNYIFPDNSAQHIDENGKTIVGYTVAGYTYNSGLKSLVRGVANSLDIK